MYNLLLTLGIIAYFFNSVKIMKKEPKFQLGMEEISTLLNNHIE